MTDLTKLSSDELLSLQARLATEIESRKHADDAKKRTELMEMAARLGLEVKIVGGKAGKAPRVAKAKGSVAAKYRHPKNPSLTWTGRGRSPVWVAEWKTAHGGSLDGITIK